MAINYAKEGRLAILTIDHPPVNAMDRATVQQLHDTIADFNADDTLWVGIITGAGDKAFCAGADIKELVPETDGKQGSSPVMPPMPWRGQDVWKPLIAAINGLALGGGLEIALCCDLRVASQDARLGLPEVNLGVMPAWGGTQRLPRMVPWCRATELILLGEAISADEAYRIGLVNRVVPAAEVMAVAREWAGTLCRVSPLGVRAAKEAMVHGLALSIEEGLGLEAGLVRYLHASEDFAEGTRAFREKRRPDFKGK